MAVQSLVSVEEYLNTSYRPDCDYVDGEVQERNLGEREHNRTQREILAYFLAHYPKWREQLFPEQRMRVSATRYRVPDVCLIAQDAPVEPVFTQPPLLCIEILSPDDRISRYLDRLKDYFDMGVPTCWLIDPVAHRGWIATPGHMDEVTDGILRSADFEMPLSEVLE